MTARPYPLGGAAALAFVVLSGGICVFLVRNASNDSDLVNALLIPMFVWSLAGPGVALSWMLPWMLPRFQPQRSWAVTRLIIRVLTALAAPPVLFWTLFYGEDGRAPDPFAIAGSFLIVASSYVMELVTIHAFAQMVDEAIATFLRPVADRD